MSQRHYNVECDNGWLDDLGGLVVRYERKAAHHLSYCTLTAVFYNGRLENTINVLFL